MRASKTLDLLRTREAAMYAHDLPPPPPFENHGFPLPPDHKDHSK